MHAFEYASPTTKEDAVKLLGAEGAAALAGGTDLLSLMKDDLVEVKRVVNLKNVEDLAGVSYDDASGLRIGAMTTLSDLEANATIQQHYPSIAQAVDGVRSRQIKNMGTAGGDLCQRPRCWFYRNGFGLLAMHEGKSLVTAGDNRYHAIFGNRGPAYFVNPSSLAPPLIALGAKLKVAGPNGEREVALESFYRAPTAEGEKEYALADDEIVTDIHVPAAANVKNATYEVRQKETLDWPFATASVALTMNSDKVDSARLVLGHVAPTPWVSEDAAKRMNGKRLNDNKAIDRAADDAVKGARALSRNEYKIRLTRVAVKRAILRASGKEV